MSFVTTDLIAEKLNIAVSTRHGRIRKLVSYGYLSDARIFFGLPGVYYLTSQGLHPAAVNDLHYAIFEKDPMIMISGR